MLLRLRRAFGGALAVRMGYAAAESEALGGLLNVEADGEGVSVEFGWSGEREHHSQVDPTDEDDLTEIVLYFAASVEGNLKEHRGLFGTRLPWD